MQSIPWLGRRTRLLKAYIFLLCYFEWDQGKPSVSSRSFHGCFHRDVLYFWVLLCRPQSGLFFSSGHEGVSCFLVSFHKELYLIPRVHVFYCYPSGFG